MKSSVLTVHNGFSLIELSVATAIFSMGLGSLSLMLMAAIHGTAESRYQTVATSEAESLAEIIAMSSDAYEHLAFPAETPANACIDAECPEQNLARHSLSVWQSRLSEQLPDGAGLLCHDDSPDDGSQDNPLCDGSGPLVIKIFWKEPRHSQAKDGGLRRVVSRTP